MTDKTYSQRLKMGEDLSALMMRHVKAMHEEGLGPEDVVPATLTALTVYVVGVAHQAGFSLDDIIGGIIVAHERIARQPTHPMPRKAQ